MRYQRLGNSNLDVSVLCLGTLMFGDRTDDAEAQRIVSDARDQGVNFVDTADAYKNGESERMLGRCLSADRDHWILATKVGRSMGSYPNQGGYSRSWILRAVEDSLKRLATDYIDIYYLHRDFDGINLEEVIRALGDLIRAGKIRYFGLSNFLGWRITQVVSLCRALNVPPPVVCQPHYNLLNRAPEVEILPACQFLGIGVVPYSPIARGVLTGKYLPGAAPPEAGSRGAGKDERFFQTEFREESLLVAQRLKSRADELGVQLGQYATAWVLRNRIVTSVIAGPRTLSQWQDYMGAVDLALDAQDELLVDSLVHPGHPSTPGYTDPSFPVLGRLAEH